MIPEILKVAYEIEDRISIQNRSKVARTAKKLGLNINYTQCKQITWIYYSVGMIKFLSVHIDETLAEYMKRTYHKLEQPYQLSTL